MFAPTIRSRVAYSRSRSQPPRHTTIRQYSPRRGYQVKVLRSASNDALFNLATEEWLFNEMDVSKPVLFLWQNSPSVIIGRHQNPWKECNIATMEKDGVVLARRKSGGGAVFQDLGNSIWTFLSSKKDYSTDRNYAILKAAIGSFGVKPEFTGRNDVVIDGKKVSGSAYKLAADRAMHHGTILVDLDKEAAVKYLNVNKEKLKSKGVDSVKQRIMNLKEASPTITHDLVCDSLVREFFKSYGTMCEIETLDPKHLKTIPALNRYYEEYAAWDWRFGKTPEFEHNLEKRFDWGIMDFYIQSRNGRIESLKIYSDTLYPKMVDELQTHLAGETYDKAGINRALDEAKANLTGVGCEPHIEELRTWLVANI